MQSTTNHATPPTQPVSLAIGGMSCGHCVAAVTEALAGLPSVEVQRVAVGAASVRIDPQATSTAALVDVVREAGYDARITDRPLPQAAGS